ncbi:MAG: isoprenylcysteine carboxylmethyltransferase family protein [Pseudomonadota bacterium]|nr:isoprenylcysteine carboxylmethyltransferase family protein [Pseudomonadota bacterium]
MRSIFFLYGVFCYLLFLGVFVYTIGFVGNFIVPKTMDSGEEIGWLNASIINLALLSLFAVQHSVMARPAFKKWWTSIVPPAIERSTYVLATNLVLIILIWFWCPVNIVIWDVSNESFAPLIWGVCALGWMIVLISTFLIDHFELFGLKQVYYNLRNREMTSASFRTPLFYKHVRHPIYFGFAVAFWATPTMTAAHLLFAIGATGYSVIGALFEERDLVDNFKSDYQEYQGKVPMLVPKLNRKK